eukprot:CAMPEP_0197573664 /NCGR_PEP_ID=MMETSP1320-20131121/43080_1 /TAXON_ID=91990 /ORGANISM="Bolidomonas sp., Strain RCC2347" /LENGTH=155 /DNA_ID=CAMNT_0043136179 /DNA_START=24 /DNA_END=491 /DNA_ORIENTATION=-
MPTLTPTLKLSTCPTLSILTFSWAKSTTSCDSPSPSLPKTITKGLLGGLREDRSTQPSCRDVARTSWVDLMSVIHFEKSGTLSTLFLNTSPMDTRMHFLYQGEQESSLRTTSKPRLAAVLIIPPRFAVSDIFCSAMTHWAGGFAGVRQGREGMSP